MQTTLAQYNETKSQDAFALQNSKLLKVRLDAVTVQAKLGSMVAYQGEVKFEHAGSGGMARLVKKMATGEDAKFMKCSGSGEVFLAQDAQCLRQPHHFLPCEKAYDKPRLLGLFCTTRSLTSRFDLQQRQARVIEKHAARCGQRNTARLALQQHYPDLQFEIANLPTQRRLRGVQPPFSGVAETAFLSHRNEITQMAKFHPNHPYL